MGRGAGVTQARPTVRHVDRSIVEDVCVAMLCHAGMLPQHAATVAHCLIEADLRGVESHGVRQLTRYLVALYDGAIVAGADPSVVGTRGAVVRVDAQHGLGHPAAWVGMHAAVERARELGVGIALVFNSNHFAAAFPYSLVAAEQGMIGFVTTNAVSVMAATGGATAAIGNNPLSWAVPAASGPPVVFDMACSQGARARIRMAANEGRSIPADWALGPDGAETTDPGQALAGALLPAGGPKGYGLAVVNELLAGALTGALVLAEIPDDVNRSDRFERSADCGHFLMALDPTFAMDAGAFAHRVDEVRGMLRSGRPAPGVEAVLVPGDRAQRHRDDAVSKGGVPLSVKTIDDIGAFVTSHGIPVDVGGLVT
jgi:LDH2 family malate/lactate/ureidoglycolate dehydrogenase